MWWGGAGFISTWSWSRLYLCHCFQIGHVTSSEPSKCWDFSVCMCMRLNTCVDIYVEVRDWNCVSSFYCSPLFWGVLWNRELPYSDRQLLVVPRSTHLYQLPTTADATDVPCRIWLSHGCWGTELWPLDCEAALHLQNHFPSPSTEHLWSHLERGALSQPQLWAFMEPLEEGCPFSFCNKISSEVTEVEGR